MRAVLYLLRSRLRADWRTSAALALVVAVLAGTVLTLLAGTVRTLTAPDRYTAAHGGGFDVTVEQMGGAPRAAELAALPAVGGVESATFVFGGVVAEDGRLDDVVDGVVFAGSPAAIGLRVVEGRAPEAAEPGELVASRSWMAASGASLGDRFDLWVIPSDAAASRGFDAVDQAARLVTGTLVGVVDGPSELQDGFPVALFPASLLEAGDVGVSATMNAVALARGATQADLRGQLDGLPGGDRFGIDPANLVPSDVRAAVRAQGQALGIVAAIALIAAVVVGGQLLGRQVRLADAERQVLASMGTSRGQLAAAPLLAAAVPVLAGAALGIGAASAASDLFPAGFARRVEPHPGPRFEAAAVVPGALVFAALILGWVAVAVTTYRPDGGAARPVAAIDTLARRAPAQVATALRFTFARHARDPIGPRPAVLGMVAVVAVLVGALTFGASLDALVERPAGWGDSFDLHVGQGGGEELPAEVQQQIERDPDVAALSLFGTVLASVGADGFDVTAVVPVVGSAPLHVFDGRLPESTDEIALGRVVARRFGVGVGDELDVAGAAGRRRLRVTGLAVLPGVEGADGVGEGGLVTLAGLRRLDPSAVVTAAGIRLRPGVSPEVAAARISERTGMAAGRADVPAAIANVARVRSMPYLVAAVLTALAVLNLVHLLIVSARRRRRDLAVLRALGARRRWVSGVVHWQVSLFSALVVAIGVPLGVAAGRIVYRAFVGAIGALDTVTVPLGLLALGSVGLLALVNVVAVPGAHRAGRRLPARALAEE